MPNEYATLPTPGALFFLLLCTCGPALLFGQVSDGFVLQSTDDGVSVSVREESNGDMSVRVSTEARAQVQGVGAVLDHAKGYSEWVHRCDGAYIVAGGQPDDYVFVSGIDMPFPFQDKEIVARVTQVVDSSGVLTRTITGSPHAIPATKGRDRPTVYNGEWIVRPLPDGRVHLQVTVRTDAGAGLPNWLRKEIMTGGPVKTVLNLRHRLEAA
ncbi:hypothetical protein LEM8419_01588 [Neolewinella maritima]|uniref:START domain-containing protein n=1 Tax=Neolewinella maritima TaxID=1383882 RepID=A0ABM9B1B4_9BACT|nr:hypothetical protein [Neolewinella maritima]CAH1000435.1 hypothetical protein LEM8419_01588 [Neolewinella maritima]